MRTPALSLVSTAAQSPFHINLLALREVLVTGFGQASKGGTVEPLRLVATLKLEVTHSGSRTRWPITIILFMAGPFILDFRCMIRRHLGKAKGVLT